MFRTQSGRSHIREPGSVPDAIGDGFLWGPLGRNGEKWGFSRDFDCSSQENDSPFCWFLLELSPFAGLARLPYLVLERVPDPSPRRSRGVPNRDCNFALVPSGGVRGRPREVFRDQVPRRDCNGTAWGSAWGSPHGWDKGRVREEMGDAIGERVGIASAIVCLPSLMGPKD